MSAPERAWRVRRAEPADRDAALLLSQRAFRQDRIADEASKIWDWIFAKNTSGSGMHYVVADAGRTLAGQYATMPIRMQHGGKRMLGLLSLHTATDPEFERQGIFTTLARRLYDEAATVCPLVYGFPNTNSAPIFYAKLGWIELRPFPLLLRPIGNLSALTGQLSKELRLAASIADGLLPGLELVNVLGEWQSGLKAGSIASFDGFGTWADALWEELSPALGTCAVRDAAFLNWRFCEAPFEYERYGLVRHGKVDGFAVIRTTTWRAAKLTYLMELMVRADDRTGAAALLAHVARRAAQSAASAVYAIATPRHPHRDTMMKMGFLPMPKAVWKNHSVGLRLNGAGIVPNQLCHVDDWYLSGADLDYV